MAVKVQFEIGHTSKLRSKKTVEGFTHDWELYVKGVQQADIGAFVEKIVFNLHESFPKPKRVCKEPPYLIQESGYAGFVVFIDIYFRNKDEPKKVQFSYDLDLQTSGPPRHRFDTNKYIIDNPSDEFRQKLLRGGGIPVTGVLGSNPLNSAVHGGVAGLPPSHSEPHKISSSEKKHKSRPDDSKLNSFANLFGPPITKNAPIGNVGGGIGGPGAGSYAPTGNTKHSPDAKITTAHQQINNPGNNLPPPKEKSSKDKDKSSEKSKERSEKREKHHKSQSSASPHKEGRSESKKSESKHEKRDKNEEKSSKKDKRDKDRDRDRDKSSSANAAHLASNNNKRPASPKPSRDQSPHKSAALPGGGSNLINNSNPMASNRPSSSQSGKLEEVKSSSKSSKESSGDGKSSKESKQKESSSSSGKKSKKEKKDKDKERDKERRHEEKEKQKLLEASTKSVSKEDQKPSLPPNNVNSNQSGSLTTPGDLKQAKNSLVPNTPGEVTKKLEKSSKQEPGRLSEKLAVTQPPPLSSGVQTHPVASATAPPTVNDKKSSSSNPPEKDKRSHKHKKKEKNKDKDKERERDKEREKDKDKDRDKDKDKDKEKDKESRKDKEAKEKLLDEKNSENFSAPPPLLASTNMPTNLMNSPHVGNSDEPPSINTTPSSSTSSTTNSSSSKSSKNKEKKSKDKSKEDKLKHKSNDTDSTETKAKQPKLSSASTSTSSSSTTTPTAAAPTTSVPQQMPPMLNSATATAASNSTHLDLSDNDSVSSAPMEPPLTNTIVPAPTASTKQTNNSAAKLPPVTHSDSSNSSFPDLSIPQKSQKPPSSQPELIKPISQPMPTPAPPPPVKDSSTKTNKSSKDKTSSASDKSSKEEEKEKKRRRNSQAANTFIEPPLKQLKKDQSKSVREKSKSPSLRNAGSRASISEPPSTFLQPGASPSSTAAAAPLPPPSSAPSAAHSPALSATEAVGNATSATANAATCNSNSTTTSTSNALATHQQLPLDYLSELQELHHKIMTLQDNEDLQHVVELIAATGCYEITTKTFDFDLCKLDRVTVQRLQEFFATSVS